ncbi:MAG: exonuclease SbcCD subunit D C-terminal domain-containing protein [Sulfurovaceae bacterium]|nr:exonuclease SbcCD subunit D C-terminal domain-containing protein [Sulfurovaceae bacterium]
MKILHTSDWHLGQNFMGKSREYEHRVFLKWLIDLIDIEKIDILIIAGDIFDTGTPPNYALELYFNFLKDLKRSYCENIIIIGGNHDSIATIKASQQLLKILNINVIASGEEDEENIIKIYKDKALKAIVCAIPFLRDSIIRKSIGGLTSKEKEKALNNTIKDYYINIYKKALEIIDNQKDIPIIATGHLTTVGSKSSKSERDIYIGNVLNISSDFLSIFDYVALGHLHLNQKIGDNRVYYSGSPIPLSFSEANSKKMVNIITFDKKKPIVDRVEIPCFRKLIVLKGNRESLKKDLEQIDDKGTWIEIYLKDDNPHATTQELYEYAKELNLSILAIKIDRKEASFISKDFKVATLDELKPIDIFLKKLEIDNIKDKEFQKKLISHFKIVLNEVEE